MDLDTWVSIAVLVGTGATICGLLLKTTAALSSRIDSTREEIGSTRDELHATRDELSGKIDATREELSSKIDATREEMRAEFKSDIGNLATIVMRLDERVYDLATGSRQHPLIVPPR